MNARHPATGKRRTSVAAAIRTHPKALISVGLVGSATANAVSAAAHRLAAPPTIQGSPAPAHDATRCRSGVLAQPRLRVFEQ
jgi:hypothetical protein